MPRISLFLILGMFWLTQSANGAPPATPPISPEAREFFEKRIRPTLIEKCFSCHSDKKQMGGLRLDSRTALLKGGDSGPAFLPGQPDKSLLVQVVRRSGDVKMPPKDKDALDAGTVEALSDWVKVGAPWPLEGGDKSILSSVTEFRKKHWSLQPVQAVPLPTVKSAGWVRNPIDRFIQTKLEEKDLSPSPEADRRTLIRRLSLDLIGLPPTPEEVDAFVADPSPLAVENLVDRLLASPLYGERWGRHWLDIARYADTKGYVFQEERRYPYAYTYRDYVVESFNKDRPYDQFILEQLAADLLPLGADRRPLAAMGFLTLGRRFLNNIHDIIDDRLDVTMRGLQGLTVACARCHDHKYDPIPARDYYSLYGVFASSTEPRDLPLIENPSDTPQRLAFEKELGVREAAVKALLEQHRVELHAKFRTQIPAALVAVRREERRFGELNRALLARWRTYLEKKQKDPIWTAWHAFATLPASEFAAKAPALSASVASGKLTGAAIHPLIAQAFKDKAPTTLADVAARYGEVFKQIDTKWQGEKVKTPAGLPSADEETLRRVLYGPDSPVDVPLAEIDKLLDRDQRNKLAPLRAKVEQWKATGPGAPPRAMTLTEGAPFNPRVFVRGNPGNPGVVVPRQYVELVAGEGRKPFAKASGRLELAQTIASKDNPLTARVMVNRVWQWHFGQGLVRTPSDFGSRGELPSHPELLDWLANTFMENDWSVKKLHRLIVLSATYRQQTADNLKARGVDPENTLLWRMNRRRLEFEPLRDSLLAVAGRLEMQQGGAAVDITKSPYPARRSIYGFIDRQNLPGVFRTFDLASPDSSTAARHATTVPQQALFLMNSPFVLELARAFAARPDVVDLKTDEAKLDRMYKLAFGRHPDAEEMAVGLEFVRGVTAKGGPTGWEQYAQVLLLANEFAFVD